MILTLVNVIYVLVAVAMIALILLQRGAGAAAGSGFGAGASATVFGARGASNFLSKSTAILAAIFFAMSLGMAMYATKLSSVGDDTDLGIMGSAPVETPAAPVATFETPAAPAATTPATPAPAASDVPAAPAPETATDAATQQEGPAEDDNGG